MFQPSKVSKCLAFILSLSMFLSPAAVPAAASQSALPNGGVLKTVDELTNEIRAHVFQSIAQECGLEKAWQGYDWQIYAKNFNVVRPQAVAWGSPQYELGELLFEGDAKLENATSLVQKMKSQPFSIEFDESTSSTTTHTVGTSAALKFTAKLPIVGGTEATTTVSYTNAMSNTSSAGKKVKWEVPSHEATIPPNRSIVVVGKLTTKTATGEVALYGDVEGSENGEGFLGRNGNCTPLNYSYTIKDNFVTVNYYSFRNIYKGSFGFELLNNYHAVGKGTYRATYSSSMVTNMKEYYLDSGLPVNNGSGLTGPATSEQSGDVRSGGLVYHYDFVNRTVTPGNPSTSLPISSPVIVYEHSNYTGNSLELPPGRYTPAQLKPLYENTISSMRVPSGYTVTVYEHGDFSGRTSVYNSNTTFLTNFNDLTSAIEVTENAAPQVRIYADAHYSGTAITLSPGRYTLPQLKPVLENTMSSLKVPSGYTVTVYEHGDFSGGTKVYTSDCTFMTDFNDLTSAIVVTKNGAPKVTLYEHASYTGKSVELVPGRYTLMQLKPILDNTVSSLKIPAGYAVTVYQNGDFTGPPKVYTSDCNFMTDFNDLTSSVVISQPHLQNRL